MAKIATYANDPTLTGTDKWIGTDGADGSTKNFSLSGTTTYMQNNLNFLDLATYDPASIEEQVVGLTATQTLTNKSIDGQSNTITNVIVENVTIPPLTGLIFDGTDLEDYLSNIEIEYILKMMSVDVYDAAGIEEQLVGLTATQTLTNKTLDFTSGGTNTISADAVDISLATFISNVVSSSDVQGGIEELDSALGARMLNSVYDPDNIREQLVGLTTTQTLTNKTLDFTSGGTNTISADAADISLETFVSNVVSANNVQDGIEEIDSALGDRMLESVYDPADVNEQLVGLTATQTLTNKSIDGDNNTITNLDASETNYDNASSTLTSTNVNDAIDELDNNRLSYFDTVVSTVNLTIVSSYGWRITARGAASAMTTEITAAAVSDMSDNCQFAFHNVNGESHELTFTGITVYGQPAGTITSSNHGDIVWIQKKSDTEVIIWGDYVNTP